MAAIRQTEQDMLKMPGFAHEGYHVLFPVAVMFQIDGIVGSLIYGSGAEVNCSAILAPKCLPGIAEIRERPIGIDAPAPHVETGLH
jgi:hypothetical protein